MNHPYSLMIKPVSSACNLQCTYCYYHKKNDVIDHSSFVMSDEILEKFIKEYFESHPGPILSFVWHGGEPLLAGIEFYKKVLSLQKKYCPSDKEYWNNIQTNGTLINEQWCQFLKENNFTVGLSIDGLKSVHDKCRGQGSYLKAKNACHLLQKYQIETDILCTVNKETIKEAETVYKELKELNTGWIQFIPIVIKDNEEDSINSREFGIFMKKIFDLWYGDDIARLGIQNFAEIIMILSGNNASVCTLQNVCGQALVVEKDGSVYSCDHFVKPEYLLGNVNNTNVKDLVYSKRQESFGMQKSNLAKRCLNCDLLKLCNGACPKDRFLYDDNDGIPYSYLCEGYKDYFSYIKEPLQKFLYYSRKYQNMSDIIRAIKA